MLPARMRGWMQAHFQEDFMQPDKAFGALPTAFTRTQLMLRTAAFLLLAFPLVLVAYQGLPIPTGTNSILLRATFIAVVLLLLTQVLLRSERLSLSVFGLSFSAKPAKHILLGLVAGTLLLGLAAWLMRLVLPFEWELNSQILPHAIAGALLFHLMTNACEELAWRGYAFYGLLRALGHWPAQIIVALIAACFHVLSGWSWQVALISTTAGSLLFALVFLRWRSIPAAIGVHAAWNWTRDLILTPSGSAAIWVPVGTENWMPIQWNIAQAILVGVTLLACAGLLWSLRKTY